MNFKQYLQSQNYSEKTIDSYLRTFDKFKKWVDREGLKLHKLTYKDLLVFIRQFKLEGKSKRYINMHLTIIRIYWNFLIKQRKTNDNIAHNLFVKGVSRRIPHDLLTEEQLEFIYENFPVESIADKRNKILLGLLVYQGLSTEDIKRLEPKHLMLDKGKIHIPPGRRVAERILSLKGHQILAIHEYLNVVRPLLLTITEKKTDYLFVTIGTSTEIRSIFPRINKKVNDYFGDFKGTRQLRPSVISNWLNHFNLREVQYMSGHKYVSSTERYQRNNLEDLKQDVTRFHPLK